MRRSIGIILGLALLALPASSFAGPVVTIELKDGRKIDADIQMFYAGHFSVRDRQSKEMVELEAASIKTIDFGDIPRESPSLGPAMLTLANVRVYAEDHRFSMLLRAFSNAATARSKDMKELDGEIAQELQRSGLTPEAKRDLGLARVLSLWAMGQEDPAKVLFAKIRDDHPADPVIAIFNTQMRTIKQWAPPPPPLPIPEKKP